MTRRPIPGPVKWTDADRATWRHSTTLDDMRGWNADCDCVVVGCGPSADYFRRLDCSWDYWTIACNRAAAGAHHDFAACFEPRKDVELWKAIRHTPAYVLSHIPRDHDRVVLTPPKRDVRLWVNPDTDTSSRTYQPLDHGQGTFYAVACAIALGFETIGVIGLDMTTDRYSPAIRRDANGAYRALRHEAERLGRRIVNLNRESRVRSLEFGDWDEVRCK